MTYSKQQTITLTSAATSVVFSSIPQTGKDLVLRMFSKTDNPNVLENEAQVKINSLTGNYRVAYHSTGGTGTNGANINATNSIPGLTNWNGSSDTFCTAELTFPNYTSTVIPKSWVGQSSTTSTTSSQFYLYYFGGAVDNAQAISQITLTSTLGQFQAGSKFSLYILG